MTESEHEDLSLNVDTEHNGPAAFLAEVPAYRIWFLFAFIAFRFLKKENISSFPHAFPNILCRTIFSLCSALWEDSNLENMGLAIQWGLAFAHVSSLPSSQEL